MKCQKIFVHIFICVTLSVLSKHVSCRSVQYPIKSDVIVTNWPEAEETDAEPKQPGWMRRQLIRFGEVASRVGNAMGTHATKITSAVDKICEIVKTVIPLMAAVCHVGQFKFCMATQEAPGQLAEAMSPTSLNLDAPDKRK